MNEAVNGPGSFSDGARTVQRWSEREGSRQVRRREEEIISH